MEQGPVGVECIAQAQNDAVKNGCLEVAMAFPVRSWEKPGNFVAATSVGQPEGF